jgi:hypothetical protein
MKKVIITLMAVCLAYFGFSQVTLTLQPGPNAGKDALLNSLYEFNNFGNHQGFMAAAWMSGNNVYTLRSVVQFDLSSIPSDAIVTDARLNLYKYNTPSQTGHSGDNGAYLRRILFDWAENSISFFTLPMTTNQNEVYLSPSKTEDQNYTNIDVTQLVIDMVNDPAHAFGFVLQLATEEKFRSLVFGSSDNNNPSLRPKLVVNYHLPYPKIQGIVSYHNHASSPLPNAAVYLYNSNNALIDSTFADENGYYSFSISSPGTFSVTAHTNLPVNGINSYDALIALKYFSGMTPLEGIFLEAADVDNNGSVTAADGLMMLNWFLGRINTFPAGNWIFENHSVTIQDVSVQANIKGLCYGDLNASRVQ